jgi:starch phosphorylase
MRYGEVSREMFPDHIIDAITNGVHAATWTAAAFRQYSTVIFPVGEKTI